MARKNKTTLKNFLLLQEFEKFCLDKGFTIQKEVLYKDLFDTDRNYRADYLLIRNNYRCMVEINGGQYSGGRHNNSATNISASKKLNTKITNYENDLMKLNLAQANGIFVFQFTYEMLFKQIYKQYFS